MLRCAWAATTEPEAGLTVIPGRDIVSDTLEARWRISDQAIANAVADETVILHLGNGTYFGLDPIGARLWEALKAGNPPSSICEAVLEAHDVEPDQLNADLRALL